MKTSDAFGIEKELSEIYEACRQHDDFTSERSKLHPFEMMSKSQTILFVDAEKNTIKQIHCRFCLGFESVKNKWVCLLILHITTGIRETFTRMKQLANARNFPKRDYFMAVPNLWNLKVIKFSGKIFLLEKFSRKSTIGFLRKSEFSKLHIWSLKNLLILRPISLVDFFLKKLDF